MAVLSTATFMPSVTRVTARRGLEVSMYLSSGHRSKLALNGNLLATAGRIYLEPGRTAAYAWCAFRSWRSKRSRSVPWRAIIEKIELETKRKVNYEN